jgi:hypothetical protein
MVADIADEGDLDVPGHESPGAVGVLAAVDVASPPTGTTTFSYYSGDGAYQSADARLTEKIKPGRATD